MFSFAACCGGSTIGTGIPQLPVGAPGARTGPATNIVVRGSFERRGTTFLAHRERLKPNERAATLTFTQLLVNTTVYPTDAAPYQIKNSVTMPYPTNGKFQASMQFSNVPVHRNELVVLDFNGVAKDGSTVDIGDLLGLINVPSTSGKTPLLTVKTSLGTSLYAAAQQRRT